jgi:hypothetical protein
MVSVLSSTAARRTQDPAEGSTAEGSNKKRRLHVARPEASNWPNAKGIPVS